MRCFVFPAWNSNQTGILMREFRQFLQNNCDKQVVILVLRLFLADLPSAWMTFKSLKPEAESSTVLQRRPPPPPSLLTPRTQESQGCSPPRGETDIVRGASSHLPNRTPEIVSWGIKRVSPLTEGEHVEERGKTENKWLEFRETS